MSACIVNENSTSYAFSIVSSIATTKETAYKITSSQIGEQQTTQVSKVFTQPEVACFRARNPLRASCLPLLGKKMS